MFDRPQAISLVMVPHRGALMTDGELVDQSRHGDRDAFNVLVARHHRTIYEVARRLLPSSDDAADVAQEVFIAAWRQLPRFQPRASFRTWLYAITLRQCARTRSRAQSRPATVDSLEAVEAAEAAAASGPDVDAMHRSMERRELEAALHAAIQSLPRAQREATALHYLGDLTCAETAAVMGISAGAVMTHLFRARKSLRAALGALFEEENLR